MTDHNESRGEPDSVSPGGAPGGEPGSEPPIDSRVDRIDERTARFRAPGSGASTEAAARDTRDASATQTDGPLYCSTSELYFSDPNHPTSGTSNQLGWAGIENAKDLDALWIAGRVRMGADRRVRISDDVDVSGKLDVNGALSVGGALSAPSSLVAGSLVVGAAAAPGAGNSALGGSLAVGGSISVGQNLSVGQGLRVQGNPILLTPTPGVPVQVAGKLGISEQLTAASAKVAEIGLGTQEHGATTWPYETIQLHPTHNLRIWFGTSERFTFRNDGQLQVGGSASIGGALEVSGTTNLEGSARIGGTTLADGHVIVGQASNSSVKVRHVNGKSYLDDSYDSLYLNWDTGRAVIVGNPGRPAGLDVYGTTNLNGSARVGGTTLADGNVVVGQSVKVRHVNGKSYLDDSDDRLYLNWDTGHSVIVGNPNHPAGLQVFGNTTVHSLAATAEPSEMPPWSGGGVVTWDLFVKATARGRLGFQTSGWDLAEVFANADASLEPGDVVAADTEVPERLILASADRASRVLGVISEKPGFLLGVDWEGAKPGTALALAGRVPVKVDLEGGTIRIGDFLCAASKPGYAKKANAGGRVIGMALERFDGHAGEQGKVVVFINPHWWPGA